MVVNMVIFDRVRNISQERTNINNMNNMNNSNPSHDVIALIPAYNEEKTIENIIKKTIEQNACPIVIDDCSSDKTYELASKTHNVLVLRNKENLGKGPAIQIARKFISKMPNLLKAKAVVILDADFQYSPKEFTNLTQPIVDGKADIVLGFRHEKDIPYFRHSIANKIWTKSINFFYNCKDIHGKPIKDICALRAYSMDTFMNVERFDDPNWLTPRGFITEAHVLIEAIKNNLKIDQSYVKVKYYEKSSVRRGIRMFLGIEFYILKNGIPYLLKRIIK